MDSYAATARLDVARQPRLPVLGPAAGRVGRACPPQRADLLRGLPPAPPRGCVGDTRRAGGLREHGVVGAAAASGENAAAIAAGFVGDAAAGVAAAVVAREETGGSEVGSKRWSPLTAAHPPPKRRAVSARRRFPPHCGRNVAAPLTTANAGSRFGDAGADVCSAVLDLEKTAPPPPPLAGGKDGALLGAVSPVAAATSLVKKLCAVDGDAPMADGGHHAPQPGALKSSEALRRSGGAAPDGLLDAGSRGVAVVSVEDRGKGAWRGELGRKELVLDAHLQANPRMSLDERSFPLGYGKDAVLSLLLAGGSSKVCLPLKSRPTDELGVLEEAVVATHGCISSVQGHYMKIVSNDGTVQDYELEGGEIPPELVVQESQVSTGVALHESTDGPSVPEINAMETFAMQPSNEKSGGDTLQCGEKRSSYLVANDVEVVNKSIGSSVNVVSASLAEDLSKQNMMGKRVSESAMMNRVSSDVTAGVCGNGTTMRCVTLHDSAACRHGDSVPENSAVETSVMQSSNEKTGGNILQCGDKKSSCLVTKDIEETNKSIRISCTAVAGSLAEDSSKQNLMGKRMSESDRMNRTSSDVAAAASGNSIMMRSKVMFTPRKVVKRTKVIQKSTLDTRHRPCPEDKEKETELSRRGIINRIEDTDKLTKDRVLQAPMTQDKEADTTRGYFGPRKRVKVKVPAHLQMKIASTCALGSKVKLDDEVASSLEDDDILKALVVHEGNLELFLNSYSGLTSARCPQNADARSKFKMLCRRFEFVCRALVQAVEQNSLKIRRIDLQADKVIRKLPGFTKSGPIVGQVPGVQVGDEFLYRVQLAIVGLHLAYQGGIDTTVYRNGERIAISIVASGGYPDELSSSGELIYSGSGGKPAGKKDHEDQKLERGNLALKNCIKTETPVRVIYGFKAQNTRVGSHSRAREVSTFTYDGLYRVLDFWMDGQPGSRVFKYKLKKITGQPELPMHIAEGMRKSKTRPGLCEIDISQGKEGIPICVINTVDVERPAPFRYTTRIRYPFELTKKRHQGCDCTNGCSDSASCACAVKNGGEIPFNLNGAIVNEKPLIFECGPSCKCPPSCQNKVSQHGLKIPLEVFRTTRTGWGVRSLRSISSGSFICEYVGELLYGNEADERRNSDFLFDIGLNHGDENFCNGLLSNVSDIKSSSSSSQILGDVGFTIDAAECGNIGRFINHSCSPNLYAQNVLWDHDDLRIPHIMFFAAETIPPLQELTYDYNYEIDHVKDVNGRIKFKICQCGSPRCSGRLY
ncbi:uncharacterized protein [Miscanthus floridulus]|uniref:uncharacterized protein n=1 Tax=Miscanthus floridulus TaxID=154761 RepID=UPI00345865C6